MKRAGGLFLVLMFIVSPIWGDPLPFLDPAVSSGTVYLPDGRQVDFHKAGITLSLPGDYAWWYGCSPTSAGMLMGHYDVNGYGGLSYSNLVPGGNAENETYTGNPGWGALANNIIASQRHVSDFYGGGYGASGDDVPGAPTGPLNCLADFMGTSQDAYGNANGSTTFWYYANGTPLYVKDIYGMGAQYYNDDGMFGIFEYMQYAGYYTSQNPATSTAVYTQYISPYNPQGFTFSQYKAEIDAGRPVLIHTAEHTMLGIGYLDPNIVQLCDT